MSESISVGLWNANGLGSTITSDVLQHCSSFHFLFITEIGFFLPLVFPPTGHSFTFMVLLFLVLGIVVLVVCPASCPLPVLSLYTSSLPRMPIPFPLRLVPFVSIASTSPLPFLPMSSLPFSLPFLYIRTLSSAVTSMLVSVILLVIPLLTLVVVFSFLGVMPIRLRSSMLL